jgi:hypothetical protein
MSTIGVVICTHLAERLESLAAAVTSVREQTRVPDELIVMVDGDADLERRVADRLPGTRVIGMGRNEGLSAARNAGVSALSAEVVAFLDDDAIAADTWIERLEGALSDSDVYGVSGRSDALWEAPRPRWLPDEFLWIVGCSYAGQPTERQQVRNVYGGCCALRRVMFDELGGYDVELGKSADRNGGGEEADLCLRAASRWPQVVFIHEPSAVILHRVPQGRLRLSYVTHRAFEEGLMKARVMGSQRGALGPERAFARRIPRKVGRQAGRALRGEAAAAAEVGGLVALTAAVLSGLVVGRGRTAIASRPRVRPR